MQLVGVVSVRKMLTPILASALAIASDTGPSIMGSFVVSIGEQAPGLGALKFLSPWFARWI